MSDKEKGYNNINNIKGRLKINERIYKRSFRKI